MKTLITALRLGALAAAVSSTGAAAATPAWQPARDESVAYQILDGDKPVGLLQIRFSRPKPDTLLIDRHEQMTVSRLMLKATLEQTSRERRVDNHLAGFTSSTTLTSAVKNAQAAVELSRDADGALVGKSSEGKLSLPADALPVSLWRGDELHDGNYFDAGAGKPLTMSVKAAAPAEKIPAGYHGPVCEGRDISIIDGKKKSRALIWSDASGRICTMRLFTDLGPLDYIPVTAAQ